MFDVSDTGVRRNSRDPEVWQLNDDLFQPVSEMLAQEYGIHHERLSQQIADIAGKLAESYWDNNSTDILAIVDGSFLMDYDDAGQELQFKSAAAISIMYTILERCGFEPEGYFDRDDFQAIYDFSTPDAVYALGTAVSECSRDVLRNIERTVKTTIRRRNVERSQHEYEEQERDLLDHRGLPAPEPDPQPAEDSVGQVRQDAPELSEAASPGAVQLDAPERNAIPASDGAGADGREPDAADDDRTAEAEPSPGQGEEPDELGEAHEQPAGANRGNHSDGADLQLSFLDAAIPTEAEQIKNINRAESEKSSSAFVLSQAEIENELRKHGSGFAGGKQRIMALYQTQPDRKLRAKALAKEYGIGGHSHDFLDGSRGFVNHDWKGFEFDHYPDHQKITLKWAQVEKYIDLMIQSDRYLTDEEKEQRTTVQEENGYKVGDDVMVDLPTGTIEGTIGYIGETDVRIDTSAHGQSWDNEVINKRQFEDGLRQNEPSQRVDEMLEQAETIYKESEVPEYERFSVREVVGGTSQLFAIWDDLNEGYYANDNGMAQFPDKEQAESYCTALKKETDERTAADWLAVEKAKFLAENEPVLALPKERDYRVGDTIRLDGKDFTVETVGTLNIQLRDPDEVYPVARSESKENLERLLRQPGNIHLHNLTVNLTPAPEPAGNFHITDDHLGEGGPKAKYQANVAAIKLLKYLEETTGQATPEQQEVLSRYVGWGGVADAFDPDKPAWDAEYSELKELLTPEKYAAARASTLNAHYTSPTVIKAIYEAVGNMGFQTGNILEPAMGVGNFFGLLPQEMQGSRLYGVELDSITGRIAKQLYPKADITVAGFETTDRRDFFDLAIGNVPFGQYQVNDRAYNKLGFSIHDYFFAKTLDQVRPGGVIAFVTSRYTMDKQSPEVRKYIAQRAELLGAIRLPNAFKANAGTEVVSDILFLQKRDRPIDIEPDWVHLGENEDGFSINQYFIDHPEMVLGRQTSESTQYGRQDFTVEPYEDLDLATQLRYAIQNIGGKYEAAELPDLGENETIQDTIPADPNVKNYSYAVVDGEVYYRENSVMVKPNLNATAKERVKGMAELRDCVHRLIDLQMWESDDVSIRAEQQKLNRLYDRFTEKYGLINSRGNALAFADDSSYYLLCSLEMLDDEDKTKLKGKADMFTKRTIRQRQSVTSVDTAAEALALSIGEKARVDMAYMSQLTGKSEDDIIDELNGVIFLDPVYSDWQTADEYLSGNVRQKLREAEKAAVDSPGYLPNVKALQAAQPKDLDASEIEVRLGATWIDKKYIQQFMFELLEPPLYARRSLEVNYSEFTAEWNISGKNSIPYNDINARMTYGTDCANAYKILEDTLNLRDVRIYDTVRDADGKEKRVLNSKETTLAQQKQQAIKEAFRDWIWRDPDRRRELVQLYNERFNSTRPREYDGRHLIFPGMNPEITLREHQLNAIAHDLYGGNTLLAHEVGAGKTFEMIAAAMEGKRLGLCQKSLFAVPNHLTEQWASEFLRLYPSANILVATKKDFETRNRKKFCARIATGDYDAVIIGHSQFERIPVSRERQERLLQEQIWEIEDGISELKASRAERFTIKELERTKKNLEAKLQKLHDAARKDDVVTFEQLGVDRLYVDEAHSFKNLFLYTKMRNVAGLSTTDAQKSSDMLLKCRYIDELTHGKGVTFATGTPISNSMTELYTMMRYLQHDMLKRNSLTHFDCWASAFGETTTAIELAPEGTGYRARTRFAKFFNLPELMNLFREAADIKTADQLNLPTPTAIYHTEVTQPTPLQQQMVQELSERAAKVHSGAIAPTEDNMLKITSDGRKLGLDQRVINPDLPDDPNSKVNLCVNNIHRIWQDGQAEKLTQLVFCDLSTPKGKAAQSGRIAAKGTDSPELHALEAAIDAETEPEEPPFTIYDDIREKLVARGIPREQIAFIHEANTEVRKKELFAKVRSGQVRVLMGSTFKMGAGMNVQDRLVALHDLDCPWRPGDLEQRSGRIIRQGNRNKEVHIYRYVTESTFDAYLWQTVENKQKFISQIMTSKSPVRSCEDIDEAALSYAEIKALCAGDERIREKMDLDVDVARLRLMKANHQSQQYRLEDNILRHFPAQIEETKGFLSGFEADMKTLEAHPHPKDGFAGMEVKGDFLTDKDNAGAAILEAFKDAKGLEPVPIGSYRGFAMSLTVENFGKDFILTLKGRMSHRVELGKDARGNLVRIDNALAQMPERYKTVQGR